MPDMFLIQLHDDALQWVDEGPFALGAEVEIAALAPEEERGVVLMKGEITSIEPDFEEGTRATLLIRGYDRSHRLHRGTHSQAFLQMTDSDIVQRIAREAGLRAQVDATSQIHEHVLQHNQTHMQFLRARAQRIGYLLYVEEGTLHFKRPGAEGSTLELEWGEGLRWFRPRLSLAEQVDQVTVKGWDPKNRQVIVGQAQQGQAEPETGHNGSGAQMASQAYGSAQRAVVQENVASQGEAEARAQALLDELSGAWIEAEGMCYGEPQLRAGKRLRLRALGRKFSGIYQLTAVTHTYRAGAGYNTYFTISGRRPDSIAALLDQGAAAGRVIHGPVVAVVTNNNDPDVRGRVKVKFPWLSQEVESAWARLAAPGAGAERGLYWLPEVNDEVLVAFEHGDINRPYVLGGLWNGQDKPLPALSEALESGKVRVRALRSREGHCISLVDGRGQGLIIETADGHRISLLDQEKKVKVETSGGLSLTLDDNSRQLALESTGALKIKAATHLTLEAGANLELKGATFTLSADATGEVKAGATLEVKGALVKIN
jgi:phage protein D/phage baseplate assembly protein gpV